MASNVGSLGGNVNLSAGGTYSQIASNVVSAKDINITAAQIELLTADEVGHSSQRDDDLKIGVFARVKSPFIDLINNVDAARQSDGRLSSMQNMAAAANAYQAASAIANATGAGGSGALFNAEAGIGFKTANSSADSSSVVSQGSTLQAGGNLNLTSTSGDIHVVQGNLSAGNTVSLDSARDILLEAGKAQLQDKSKSSNAGAEVGVGVQVGAQTGAYVYAEASVGSSKSNADSTTWQNTTLTGQNISLKAEGDTTLRGATATADRIDVKTGGTLTVESLQDVAESMSKNSQVGGRVQVSIGTAWNADGYASAGKSNGSYQGVGQQSGLFAGAGGYHVDATHVNLVGGAIASTNAANSELTAETLTFSDLQNHMQHNTASAGISGGYSGAMDGWTPQLEGATPNFGPGLPMIDKGGDSSTTHATLTEGSIVIGGKQTTAAELGLNTDAAAAHRAIDALPNVEKLLADQQAMAAAMGTVTATSKQIANDIGGQAMRNLENDYVSKLSDEEKARFKAQSAQDKAWELKTQRGSEFNAAEDQMKNWGIGSANGRALEAVTALLVGGMSGQGGGQLAANALAPYAAQLIGSKFDTDHGSDPNVAAQALSHALLGAVLAELNGGSAGGGALSAAGGELAAGFLKNAFPNADRETISALSQAVGALAAGMAGGSLSSAALGAGIAKNSVENNRLLTSVELARIKELSNGDLSREVELTAAACALVKCSAGFPEGSEEHARWADIEAFGSAPALQDDRDWLKAQVQPNYSLYAAGKGINSDYTLFAYGLSGQYDDWFSRNQGSTRVQGGLQMLTGVAQAAGGFALVPTCETGIGCVASAYLAASGYDNAVAGWRTAIDGKFAATLGGRVFQVGGVSPEVAEMLYALTQVAAAARVPAINPGNAFAEFGSTPPRISNGVILDPRLPDPVAGLGYEPTVLNSFNPNIANSHLNGYVGELKLANTVASLPDQVVVKYGDAIGRNGADVISVDAKTGAVTLWDNKFRSTRAGLRGSPTFAEGSPALESARQEAIIAIERSSLPAATKAKALDQLLDRTFTTHTVGSGSARNSTISKFCNGSICE